MLVFIPLCGSFCAGVDGQNWSLMTVNTHRPVRPYKWHPFAGAAGGLSRPYKWCFYGRVNCYSVCGYLKQRVKFRSTPKKNRALLQIFFAVVRFSPRFLFLFHATMINIVTQYNK